MTRLASLFASSLVACSMSASPPPSRGLYAPVPGSEPAAVAAPAPVAPPPAPVVATGLLRIDGSSIACTDVASIGADGAVSLLCTLARENACVVRRIAANGNVIADSERVPGTCRRVAPHADGGLVIATLGDDYHTATIARLDASGRRIAMGAFTSKESIWISDVRADADGGVLASLEYRKDVAFRGKRLGTTKFTTAGIVKLKPTLDRLAWVRLFDTRKTWIAALLPPTRDGVDALINTRGPLVDGAPVNPPVNPEDGSVFGGDTYGWKAERVAFDRKGAPAARTDATVEPKQTVVDAAQIGDALAVLTSDPVQGNRFNMTLLRGDDRQRSPVGILPAYRFTDEAGTPLIIECDCTYDQKLAKLVGTWRVREAAPSGRAVTLTVPDAMKVLWASAALRDDRLVLLGNGTDTATNLPIVFTALVQLPPGAATVDLAALQASNRLQLAPGCSRAMQFTALVTPAKLAELDAPLEACGVTPTSRISLTTFPEGGLRSFTVRDAPAKVTTCARELMEPLFACPLAGSNVDFAPRYRAPAR